MPSWYDDHCGGCERPFAVGETTFKRRVPHRGGRKLEVCGDCASTIDKQDTLEAPEGGDLGAKPKPPRDDSWRGARSRRRPRRAA